MYIIKIKHDGQGFTDSDCAKLLYAGILYHYVIIYPEGRPLAPRPEVENG